MNPEKERLHQAILDDPDDGAVRLVYADWLEENGRTEDARDHLGPRGICSLAEGAGWPPSNVWTWPAIRATSGRSGG